MDKKRFIPHVDWINKTLYLIVLLLILVMTIGICLFPKPLAICL